MRPILSAVAAAALTVLVSLSLFALTAAPASAQGRGGPVCVYEHANFAGRQLCFRPGENVPSLRRYGEFWNDRVSSIVVAPGFVVRVCQHDNFSGRCSSYDHNVNNLASAGFNDAISSVSVGIKNAGPGGPPSGRDDLRERMMGLRDACDSGDRRACVRFGIIIGENRERRAQWRRESPDLFWWDQ